MKKILSVVLAGAMILGMSVSAFAANNKADVEFGAGTAGINHTDITDVKKQLDFKYVYHNENGKWVYYNDAQDVKNLKAGDELYFQISWQGASQYTVLGRKADEDWVIKVDNSKFVSGASFYYDNPSTIDKTVNNALYVKVTLEDDFDAYEENDLNFHFYIYDTENDVVGDKIAVNYKFVTYDEVVVDRDDLKWVLTVDQPTTYKYKKGEKAAKATIDFDGDAYTEFKMYADEKYTLALETKYNKPLSKEYDTDVEVITLKYKGVDNFDVLFPASKDNKQVVAVVDGELVPVDAEYVKDHKFESGKKANGYLVEDAEYTQYAVIDKDVEIEVAEEDNATEEKPSTDKQNPAMGANDFVGAAVALAVVSVAAAGALALKK